MLRRRQDLPDHGRVDGLRVSRRAGLAGLAATLGALAVGCTTDAGGNGVPSPGPGAGAGAAEPSGTPVGPDPDVALAETVRAAEADLLDRIDAVVTAYPGLRGALEPTRAAHEAHVALLAEASPSRSPSPSPSTTTAPYRAAGSRTEALTALARREARLALLDKQSAFTAESGAFARVLASMAAAAAQQAVRLRDLANGAS